MYSIQQPYPPLYQQAHMNSDQTYAQTVQTTNNHFTRSNNGSQPNDQVLVQQWNNNNGQTIDQTRQMSGNQGQFHYIQQQPLQ
jgi:hypothetical protein